MILNKYSDTFKPMSHFKVDISRFLTGVSWPRETFGPASLGDDSVPYPMEARSIDASAALVRWYTIRGRSSPKYALIRVCTGYNPKVLLVMVMAQRRLVLTQVSRVLN